MSAESFERATHTIKFSDALDLIESKIQHGPGTELEGRIPTPFEASIAKDSISVEALQRYASLGIECILYHKGKGDLVISTGGPATTTYDFGPEIDSMREDKDRRLYLQRFLTENDDVEFAPLQSVNEASKTKIRHMRIAQPFIAHQHPSGRLELSGGDILSSAAFKSEIDILLTKDGVVFYKANEDQANRLRLFMQLHRSASGADQLRLFEKFKEEEGFIKKTVSFGSPKMEKVVTFLRGETDWQVLQSVL